MRAKFLQQLELLNNELIAMGSLCETTIAKSAKALIENNENMAREVLDQASVIDQKQRDIERICMKLLLTQQPVAQDLRLISSALKMITDMERIGDQAEDIAEIVTMAKITADKKVSHIKDMAVETINMVSFSIDAYIKKDTSLAKQVIEKDDIVDNLFREVKAELMEVIRSGDTTEAVLDLLMIAKYFERIGDHATNIAETVLYCLSE